MRKISDVYMARIMSSNLRLTSIFEENEGQRGQEERDEGKKEAGPLRALIDDTWSQR